MWLMMNLKRYFEYAKSIGAEFEEVKDNTSEEIVLHDINTDCVEIESIEEVKETFEMRESKRKSKARKNSFKNKENSY